MHRFCMGSKLKMEKKKVLLSETGNQKLMPFHLFEKNCIERYLALFQVGINALILLDKNGCFIAIFNNRQLLFGSSVPNSIAFLSKMTKNGLKLGIYVAQMFVNILLF